MVSDPETVRRSRQPGSASQTVDAPGVMQFPTCYADGYARARARDPRRADQYIRHTRIGDPMADAVVEELDAAVPPGKVHAVIAEALHSPTPNTPEFLRTFLASARARPDWFDPRIAMVGTRAFLRNSDTVIMALVCGAIIEGFSTLIAKSFRIRGRILDNGVRRLKQNMLQLVEQFLPGGIEPGGDGWRLTLRIRLVHAQSRRLLRKSPEWDSATHGMPLSAAHLMLGAAAFSARLMRHVALLGGDFSDEEREAYVHVWRYGSVLLGVPEPIRFTDQASALQAFATGAACEPDFDEDSIIMANSIINSAPLLLGYRKPRARGLLASTLYQVSRELIGAENADALRFPPRARGISRLCLMRWRTYADRLLRGMPGSRGSIKQFSQLLDVSNLERFEHDYSLPTAVHDEESRPW